MRVWRMSLRRTKNAIISWAGSIIYTIETFLEASVNKYQKSEWYCNNVPQHKYCKVCLQYEWNIWAATWQNQQSDCAPSEDSDQPGHPPSLIRVFAGRMKKAWVLSYPLSAQRRLWSDWAAAQADLSLRWAHSHIVGFVMRWLICLFVLEFYGPVNSEVMSSRSVNSGTVPGQV